MLKLSTLSLLVYAGWSGAQQADGSPAANACAMVSQSVQDFTTSAEEPFPKVPAKLAYDCLRSVPINAERASELLHSLSSWAEFHTTLAYLKDPPEGYSYPAVDIPGQMQNITKAVESGQYDKEYDYAVELYSLYQRSHDSHFSFSPDILFSAFTFKRPVKLTSVSKDGQQLPKVYSVDNLLGDDDSVSLPITSINGENVTTFLDGVIVRECHDPDVCYNSLLYTPNYLNGRHEGEGYFAQPDLYPGEATVLGFENGTTVTLSNYAEVIGNFTGVDSPQAFYSRFCNLTLNDTQEVLVSNSKTMQALRDARADKDNILKSYPAPAMAMDNQKLAGYFLNETGMEDVAILSIPIFSPGGGSAILSEPQAFVEDFFNSCKEKGMTKLVVDVQGNQGGMRALGVDFFAQIFPDIEPSFLERIRAHESANIMGKEVAKFLSDEQILQPENVNPLIAGAYHIPFNYLRYLEPSGEPFESYEKFYGPYETYGDNFTALHKLDFDMPAHLYIDDAYPTGYGNRSTDGLARPFEDVIILTDGLCGSTCSLFVDLMTRQANVPTVTIGGRPNNGPMMAVGETRGPNSFAVAHLLQHVQSLTSQATKEQLAALQNTKVVNLTDVPIQRAAPAKYVPTINFADSIRANDDSETPLQFIYEAADCRLFRTTEMLHDVTAMWRAVTKVMNGEYDACVKDSMGHGKDGDDGIGEIVEERAGNSTDSESGGGSSDGTETDEKPALSVNGASALHMAPGTLFKVGILAAALGLWTMA